MPYSPDFIFSRRVKNPWSTTPNYDQVLLNDGRSLRVGDVLTNSGNSFRIMGLGREKMRVSPFSFSGSPHIFIRYQEIDGNHRYTDQDSPNFDRYKTPPPLVYLDEDENPQQIPPPDSRSVSGPRVLLLLQP